MATCIAPDLCGCAPCAALERKHERKPAHERTPIELLHELRSAVREEHATKAAALRATVWNAGERA